MDYRREVDGLRALAVVPVILFHAGFETFSGGFVGVDVFFVISGYLITTILLSELEQGRFSIVGFYERRARRILPALFLVMLVSLPFAWFWLLPGDMKDYAQSLAAVAVFASNFLFWQESGYFDTAAEFKPLLHTWSLAVEEQYYLLFPLLLMLAWRLGRRWVAVLLGLVIVASLALAQWESVARPATAFYLLPARGWELLMGALAAFCLSRTGLGGFDRRLSELGAGLGLALIVYPVFSYSKATPFPGLHALVPTLGAVLVILFATRQTVVGQFVGNRVFVGIGLVSYSAYLWHQPLFAFARHMGLGGAGHGLFAALGVAALVLSYFTWKYVEAPFRNRLRFRRGTVFSLGLVFSVFFVGVGYLGHKREGFDHRFEKMLAGDVGHLEFHRQVDREFVDCEPAAIAREAPTWEGFLRCKQSVAGEADVVLLGDSHAEHLFLGLAQSLPEKNVAFYITRTDPTLAPGLDGKPYVDNPQFKRIFDHLLSTGKPRTILLTMHYVERLGRVNDLMEGFSRTITALKGAGHRVVLLGDVPRFQVDPGICAYKLPFRADASTACRLSIEEVEAQRQVYRPVLRRLSAEQGVALIEIDEPLCSHLGCGMVDRESVLYRDPNHLNIIGSQLVGRFIAQGSPL